MDATRETVTVSIAGREIAMLKPTENQLVGLNMWNSKFLSPTVQLKSLTDMFLSLLPDDDSRAWLMEQMMSNEYSLEDIATTLTRVATAPADEPKKTAAKKTAAKKH